jgi:hypothetical protein
MSKWTRTAAFPTTGRTWELAENATMRLARGRLPTVVRVERPRRRASERTRTRRPSWRARRSEPCAVSRMTGSVSSRSRMACSSSIPSISVTRPTQPAEERARRHEPDQPEPSQQLRAPCGTKRSPSTTRFMTSAEFSSSVLKEGVDVHQDTARTPAATGARAPGSLNPATMSHTNPGKRVSGIRKRAPGTIRLSALASPMTASTIPITATHLGKRWRRSAGTEIPAHSSPSVTL